MDVLLNAKPSKVAVEDLLAGDVFKVEGDNGIFMKLFSDVFMSFGLTSPKNAISIESGIPVFINPADECRVISGSFIEDGAK